MNHVNLSQRLFLIIILICPIYILLRSCVVSCEPPKAGTVHPLRPHPYSTGRRRRGWEVAELLNTHGKTKWLECNLLYHIECFSSKSVFRNVHTKLRLEPLFFWGIDDVISCFYAVCANNQSGYNTKKITWCLDRIWILFSHVKNSISLACCDYLWNIVFTTRKENSYLCAAV